MPGFPLDNGFLAVLAVGLPVGLSIYWAWVHREWSGKTKATGFAVALAGALAGAWLGLHAAADLLALITSIVGAVAGANLALILFDISHAQRVAAETADASAGSLEPAAPTGAARP